MSNDRIEIEPDADGGLEQIWIGGQPVGKMLQRLNKRIGKLESENDELRQENERLTERVAELEAAVDPDPTGKAYKEMSRDEAVRKIRETVLEQAQRSHSGKAQMTYKEVLALLDHEPSVGHAYNLMERAGREDGFQYTDNNGKVIQANSEGVKDETLFHGVNKAYSSGAD